MKKTLSIIFIISVVMAALIAVPAAAETVINCVAADAPVINTLTRSNENALPYLSYGDITYIPLDDYHQALLNVSASEADGRIIIESSISDEYRLVNDSASDGFNISEPVFAVEKDVVVNGREYTGVRSRSSYLMPDNSGYYPYPFLRFNGTLYMPLTWQYAQDMGWTISSEENQLRIYADSRFSTFQSSGEWMNGWYQETAYYLVSGINCVRIKDWYRRFFSGFILSVSSGGDFSDFSSKFFKGFSAENMTISGNELEITANYYGYAPDHVQSATPTEIYRLKIDIPTLTLTDTKLIKRNVFNRIYGAFENENGNFDEEVIYDDSYFYYAGGHVILNGTAMRSYTGFVYKVYRTDEGLINSWGASADPYWICAEDLENYGYDMTVDLENRATYFTRNPEKEITPLGFEGTNEHLPIYESDWKIYIDGVEPKLYYNIGGYTMVNSGELGEYEDSPYTESFYVRSVTTPDMAVAEPKIVGYYSVDVFDEPVENLQSQYLTDVMYAFIIPHADGTIYIPKPDILRELVEKAHADGAKVHASIGGWSAEGENLLSNFITIASDEELTRKFIESCVWLIREYDLDGIEIDWEHPTAETAELYENFMLAVCSDPRIPSVSAALCGCSTNGVPVSASAAVSDAVTAALDFINVMAYDTNDSDHSPYDFSASSLNYWLGRGVPREKLILGIPLYARPSFLQYRHLAEAGYDILHSEYADTPYSPSYYNSLDTIRKKVELAKEIAGGVMFFDIHEDTSDETSAARAAYEILKQ